MVVGNLTSVPSSRGIPEDLICSFLCHRQLCEAAAERCVAALLLQVAEKFGKSLDGFGIAKCMDGCCLLGVWLRLRTSNVSAPHNSAFTFPLAAALPVAWSN